MDWTLYIYKTIFLVIIFLVTLVVAMYSTYGERKVAAFMQDRRGPNRAGLFGLLQPLADGVKMFMKEEIIPTTANKKLFILAGIVIFLLLMTYFSYRTWNRWIKSLKIQVNEFISDGIN